MTKGEAPRMCTWTSLMLILVLFISLTRSQHKFFMQQEVSCGPALSDHCTCHMTPELYVTCHQLGNLPTWPSFPSYITDVDTSVDTLVLSDNAIGHLSQGAFNSLLIRNLDLSRNDLSNFDFHENVLDDDQKTYIRSLDLSYNFFSGVPPFAQELINLQYLDLRENQLFSVIQNIYFQSLTNLRQLYLPSVVGFEEHALVNIKRLKLLEFSPNAFLYATEQVAELIGQRNIESLRDLETLIMYSGDFSLWQYQLFDQFVNLNHLEMIDSHLDDDKVYGVSVSDQNVIDTLSLARNRFTKLPVDFMRNLRKLKHLDVSGNKLRRIHRSSFNRNRRLMFLDLHNNRITVINGMPFHNLNDLVELNLSGNRLTTLSEMVFPQHLMTGMVLHLGNNPLVCTCDIWWLAVLVKQQMDGKAGPLVPFEVANEIACSIINLDTVPLYEAYQLLKELHFCGDLMNT